MRMTLERLVQLFPIYRNLRSWFDMPVTQLVMTHCIMSFEKYGCKEQETLLKSWGISPIMSCVARISRYSVLVKY